MYASSVAIQPCGPFGIIDGSNNRVIYSCDKVNVKQERGAQDHTL